MSLLQAYLQKPSTQRALSRKPGDKGFSLIELVVVVAVLAILAAIAIPQFSQLSDDARLNSAKSIIANMYKECEFNKARKGTGEHSDTDKQPLNGVTWDGELASGTTTCDSEGHAEMSDSAGTNACYVIMDLSNGEQSYINAAAGGLNNYNGTTAGWPQNLEDCT